MLLICYPKCSTCQKAKKWLDGKDIAYTERNIAEENPTYEELKEWYEKSGLPLKKFFNTSGLLYKSMQLKDKLPDMSEEEQLKLVLILRNVIYIVLNVQKKRSERGLNRMESAEFIFWILEIITM